MWIILLQRILQVLGVLNVNFTLICHHWEMGFGREGELKPMNAEQLRECGHKMVDFIADYYKNIENFPVLSQVQVLSLQFSFFTLFSFSFFFSEFVENSLIDSALALNCTWFVLLSVSYYVLDFFAVQGIRCFCMKQLNACCFYYWLRESVLL